MKPQSIRSKLRRYAGEIGLARRVPLTEQEHVHDPRVHHGPVRGPHLVG